MKGRDNFQNRLKLVSRLRSSWPDNPEARFSDCVSLYYMYRVTSIKKYDRVTCIAHGRSLPNLASKTSIFNGEVLCSTESILAATSGDRPLTVVRNQSHQYTGYLL